MSYEVESAGDYDVIQDELSIEQSCDKHMIDSAAMEYKIKQLLLQPDSEKTSRAPSRPAHPLFVHPYMYIYHITAKCRH